MLRSLLTTAILLAGSLAGRDPLTVLPLGDSITAGGGPNSCYREFLVPELARRNVRVIGPMQDKISPHAGYGGRNSSFLRDKIEGIYGAHPADVVLIHAGHNHFARDQPVPTIVKNTEAILRTIHRIHPQATVLLGQVIPSGKLPKYAYIPELNRQLAELAGRLDGKVGRVILVDHASGFDWRTDTLDDRVHPNPAGARKMANRWLEALVPMLPSTDEG